MPKKPRRAEKKPDPAPAKADDEAVVDIGTRNVKNWQFLRNKLNFSTDPDFVEYLLSAAEKYLW